MPAPRDAIAQSVANDSIPDIRPIETDCEGLIEAFADCPGAVCRRLSRAADNSPNLKFYPSAGDLRAALKEVAAPAPKAPPPTDPPPKK